MKYSARYTGAYQDFPEILRHLNIAEKSGIGNVLAEMT